MTDTILANVALCAGIFIIAVSVHFAGPFIFASCTASIPASGIAVITFLSWVDNLVATNTRNSRIVAGA